MIGVLALTLVMADTGANCQDTKSILDASPRAGRNFSGDYHVYRSLCHYLVSGL